MTDPSYKETLIQVIKVFEEAEKIKKTNERK